MVSTELTQKTCKPCEGGVIPLTPEQYHTLLQNLSDWSTQEGRLHKSFRFDNFIAAMVFVNQVAELAETEGHHPDIHIHYNQVIIELWTHSINGLSENDFIVASKIDHI